MKHIQFKKAEPSRSAFISEDLKRSAQDLLDMYDRLISSGISTPTIPIIRSMLAGWVERGCWNTIAEYLRRHVYGCHGLVTYSFKCIYYRDIVTCSDNYIYLN